MKDKIIEFGGMGVNDEDVKKFEQGFWAYAEKQKLKEQRKIEKLKKEAKELLLSENATQKEIKWAKTVLAQMEENKDFMLDS